MPLQRELRAILFCDIRGFSNLHEYEIECFAEDVIPDLFKQVINRYENTIIDINTWGDGLVIVAKDPAKLARVALDIQDFYNRYTWLQKRMPVLTVRISLHLGTIFMGFDVIRKREGVIGTQLNMGARLEPIVTPGEIWCTNAFKAAIDSKVDPDLRFLDIGKKELPKDYGIISVFKVVHGRRTESSPK